MELVLERKEKFSRQRGRGTEREGHRETEKVPLAWQLRVAPHLRKKGGRGKQSAGQQEASDHPASGREACFLSNCSGKTRHSSGLDDEMVNEKQESVIPQASHLNVLARILEIRLNYLLCRQTPNYEHKDQINGK